MADRREREGAVSIRIGGGQPRVIEIYSAMQWPDQPEADAGLYRVRIGRSWVCAGGQRYTFFTPEALGRLLAQELCAPGALESIQRPAPKLRARDRVRYTTPEGSTVTVPLASDPVLWIDGQWRALIRDIFVGQRMVCCDELTRVDRFGREVPS